MITIITPEEISVEELLKLFFKKINTNPNDNQFWFLFKQKNLKLNCKEIIKEYGLGNFSDIIMIYHHASKYYIKKDRNE